MLRNIIRKIIKAGEEEQRIFMAMTRLVKSARGASNLLDVGCADGNRSLLYAGLLGITPDKIKGIEPQAHYLLPVREKFETLPVDIEKNAFPFADESFDLIICKQVLEHLKNIFRPLSEMDRTLKTGGQLIIGIPNLAGLYNRLLLAAGFQPMCNRITGPHIRSFAHKSFLEFLKSNSNFELIKIDSATLYPLPYPLVDWLGRIFPGLAAYTFYLLKKKKHDPPACAWNVGSKCDTLFD